MVQILKKTPGLGERLGAGFGTGLSQGLQELAHYKIGQMQAKKRQEAILPALQKFFPGSTPEELSGIASLDPKILENLFKNAQVQTAEAPIQSALEEIISSAAQIPSREESIPTGTTQEKFPIVEQKTPQVQQPAISETEEKVATELTPGEKALKEIENLEKYLQNKNLTPQQKSRLRTEIEKRTEKYNSDQEKINKATQAYYDQINAYAEAADKADNRLGKMKNLIKKGNLPYSTFYNLFNKLEEMSATSGAAIGGALGGLVGLAGGPLAIATAVPGAAIGAAAGSVISPVATILKGIQKATSPDLEEFEKLSYDFIRDAKAIFGNRITDADLQAFLKMIPTLSNTDQGKLAIIHNMELFNKAQQIKAKEMKKIIKEHKGKRPENLRELTEERAKPQLDRLSEEFQSVHKNI